MKPGNPKPPEKFEFPFSKFQLQQNHYHVKSQNSKNITFYYPEKFIFNSPWANNNQKLKKQ